MDRLSFEKRISDGFFPPSIVKCLLQPIIPGTVFNGFTIVHMLSGMIMGLVIEKWWHALIFHTMWELFQFAIGDNTFTQEDLLFDIPLDTLAFMTGWFLVRKCSRLQF